MKRLLTLALACVLVLSLAACDSAKEPETTAPSVPETTAPATQPTYPQVENPVTFFSLSMGENYENIRSITVFANEDGTVHVEYVGDVKKVGDMDASVFHGITEALAQTGLAELNGQDAWGEGEANGSMYIDFADGTSLACGFGGTLPEAYVEGYNTMDAFFQELTNSLPVYVPQPMVQGQVDETLLAEMNTILSGIPNADGYVISHVEKDDYFAFTLGLSSDEGVDTAANCAPMMMTTAYSLSLVKLAEGADAEAVCADFAANVDWMKWVCVAPTDAIVATKDNMVLCLIAADELFEITSAGVNAAGWTVVETLENPNA
ncbi:MAG: hypothetical protein IJ960_04465 [Oscillospiraceae bacterium]|nr:hypothetical protein [Oscillospiraceae bacterium]